jgi:hypothetical protein
LKSCVEGDEFEFEFQEDLVFDFEKGKTEETNENCYEDDEEDDGDDDDSDEDHEVSSSSYEPSPTKRHMTMGPTMAQKKKAVEFWRSGKKGTLKFETVRHNFRFIRSRAQLHRYERQVQEAGTRKEKFCKIHVGLLSRFQAAKEALLPVHDNDLKRWALEENKKLEQPLKNFKASIGWIWMWKKTHSIVSRKITRVVSNKYSLDQRAVSDTAIEFVKQVRDVLDSHPSRQVLNTDQSGFKKELHSGRTLDFRGRKSVESVVQSVNATTHSYTIQPTISMDGELMSPLLICLQEAGGKFPRTVTIFQAPNIHPVASASGLMTKNLLINEYFKEVLFPAAKEDFLLLVDSWGTYKDQDAIVCVEPDNKTMTLMQIPPKTTGIIQPLDVYFFRMWKDFIRKVSDRILLDRLEVNLFQRDNILKIQSITHNQFSASRFKNFIKYAWFKAGYIDQRPEAHVTPVQYCFEMDIFEQNCQKLIGDGVCEVATFIRCSHCELRLCFSHFYFDFHYCNS